VSTLRDRIIGRCRTCDGSGMYGDSLCACSIKFRVFNRLVGGDFREELLDLVSSYSYEVPLIEDGEGSLGYFIENPFTVLEKGLSLFIFSRENGRGKTTLAHYLAYSLAWPCSHTENYKRDRTYGFSDVHKLFEDDNSFRETSEIWKSTFYVLDDLGNEERSSDWKKQSYTSTLHKLLHYRRGNRLPTIITSNYDPRTLSSFYNGYLDSVLEIRPDGRIHGEFFRQVEVGGAEDFRLANAEKNWPA